MEFPLDAGIKNLVLSTNSYEDQDLFQIMMDWVGGNPKDLCYVWRIFNKMKAAV